MKKTPIAIAIATATLAFSGGAAAESVSATTTVASTCAFSNTSQGTLVVSGTSVTTDAGNKPTTTVTQNDPAGFDLTVGTATPTFPGSLTMATKNIDVVKTSGSNPVFGSTANEGDVETLQNVGSDVFDFDFTATLSDSAIAGTYTIASEMTCVAAGG